MRENIATRSMSGPPFALQLHRTTVLVWSHQSRHAIPEGDFLHAGGLYQEGKHPKNVSSYFGYIDEAQYIAGMVAGHTSRSGKLGFVRS